MTPSPVSPMTHRNTVRERPILMSGAMVRAILSGSKTQTRRVLGVQPLEILLPADERTASLAKVTRKWDGKRVWFALTERGERIEDNHGVAFRCKYGEVGDWLWVRETWARNADQLSDSYMDTSLAYRADGETRARDNGTDLPWKPSIFMPRWASRFTLEVAGVRVERVQSISEEDAKAEGLAKLSKDGLRTWKYGIPDRDGLPGNDDDGWHWSEWDVSAVNAYAKLWDSINAKRGYSWESNPWVWVLEFRALSSPLDDNGVSAT